MEIVNKYLLVRFNIETLAKNPILQSDNRNELLSNLSTLNHSLPRKQDIRYYVESSSLYLNKGEASKGNDFSNQDYSVPGYR
jgi:hypothetical protein